MLANHLVFEKNSVPENHLSCGRDSNPRLFFTLSVSQRKQGDITDLSISVRQKMSQDDEDEVEEKEGFKGFNLK